MYFSDFLGTKSANLPNFNQGLFLPSLDFPRVLMINVQNKIPEGLILPISKLEGPILSDFENFILRTNLVILGLLEDFG